MKRRAFICGGMAAILASRRAPAFCVAMRNGMMRRGGGWTNPYVTDGLVAMWDGEWNAGGGMHDANATTWKDLSGTFDASKSGSPSFGDNYTVVSGDGYWIVPETIAPVVLSADLTAEVVFSTGSSTILNQCVLAFGPTSSASRILYLFFGQYPQNKKSNFFWTYKGKQAAVRTTGSGALGFGIHTTSIVVSSGVFNGYFDGGLKTFGNAGGSTSSWSGIAQIGKGTNALDGHIYCVRMYSRPLTSTELDFNHAIDKARFNIA